MDIEKIKTRIARALALAADQAGTSEGCVAAMRAAEMAAKYGIDVATLTDAGRVSDEAIRTDYTPASSSLWRASLAWKVAEYAGIRMIRLSGSGGFALIGRKADIATWKALYERAEADINTEGARYVRSLPAWASAKSEGDTFRKHAASGFGARLRDHAAAARASEQGRATEAALATAGRAPGGTALVMVGRALAVQAREQAEFPKLGTVKIKTGGSSRAASDGYRFGRGMGVHRGNLGGAS
jgi:hypothetical protein